MPATVTYTMRTYRVATIRLVGTEHQWKEFGETNKGCFETCGPNF